MTLIVDWIGLPKCWVSGFVWYKPWTYLSGYFCYWFELPDDLKEPYSIMIAEGVRIYELPQWEKTKNRIQQEI